MKVGIELGSTRTGEPATVDLEELLATRLLVQGNSGSGKSHLLRRLLEQSAQWVQQTVIDPEGDFVTLAEAYGHVVVDASEHTDANLQRVAARVRQHRISVVLNLEHLETEDQMRRTAAFLGGMFDVDRDHWYPMLVVVDEAQMFAPTASGEYSDEARKAALGAMTNLMCRGRKRGLAGVIATQRLAKLAKNVAAEASNFLMGRTFLDIDMTRAADLLGMERRQAEMFRDLERGHFIALGPALSRRPLSLKVGSVQTAIRAGSPRLLPLPETPPEAALDLIMTPGANERPPPPPRRPMPAAAERTIARLEAEEAAVAPPPVVDRAAVAEQRATLDEVLRVLLTDPEAPFRSEAVLYQDFLVRCRERGLNGRLFDLPAFRRRLAVARAGVAEEKDESPEWSAALSEADRLPEDLRGLFLLVARAALDGAPCPSDAAVARARGSRSPRRGRGLLEYLAGQGVVEIDEPGPGRRVILLPTLGWATAPGDPDADDA